MEIWRNVAIFIPKTRSKMQIEPFSPENFDAVEKMVTAVWGDPVHLPEYDHAFCGHLTRYSYYDPELSFQIVDEEEIQGVCLVSIPGETNEADAWLEDSAASLTDDERNDTYAHRAYLKSIDAITCRMMKPKDAKLSFLLSQKKGCGAVLLEHTMNVLSERGFENLYLWTDSSCNWEFYLKHGFELVHEEKSDLYSTLEEDFKFMVFRKSLDDLPKLMRKQP